MENNMKPKISHILFNWSSQRYLCQDRKYIILSYIEYNFFANIRNGITKVNSEIVKSH